MRAVSLALLALFWFASSATGQDNQFRVLDLEFRILDLDLPEMEVAGAVTDLEMKETETEIRIALSADVLFDFDKSDIKPEAATALRQVAAVLKEHPGQPVRIEGHTDSKGSDAYNRALSEDRALSVRDWLVDEEGVDGADFEIVGFGESRPAAPNEKADGSDDPEARQKNRRVEIVIGKQG